MIMSRYSEQRIIKTNKKDIFEVDLKGVNRPITIEEFKKNVVHIGDENPAALFATEEQIIEGVEGYWKDLKKRCTINIKIQTPVMYGTDIKMSFFPQDLDEWNLNKLTKTDSIIHKDSKVKWIEGIQIGYAYVGTKNSSFSMHCEDRNLMAVNFNHYGAPKIWYGVKRDHAEKLIARTNGCITQNEKKKCDYITNLLFQRRNSYVEETKLMG